MKIIILNGCDWISDSKEVPVDGHSYYLFDAEEYTAPMRKLWEALVDIAYKSGAFSYDTTDKSRFRDFLKRDYGDGYSHYEYSDNDHNLVRVSSLDNIPTEILDDFRTKHPMRIKAVLKSSTRYTKKIFSGMIDNTIVAMQERGIETPKFLDIIDEISQMRD